MNNRLSNSIKNPQLGAIAAFVFGLFVHFIGLVNTTHNYDNIATPFGIGAGVTSGRWFLEILGSITKKLLVGSYNLTWFNGIVFLLLLAASVYFLISTLEIQNRVSAVIIGMAFVSFPTAASTLFFRYTATYYGIAILLSVLAAWVLKNWKYGLLPSALLTALSLGIYQAQMPITVGIFVLVLLRQALTGEHKVSALFRRGVYYCASILIGLVLYYVLMKVSLAFYGASLDNYQGLDQMGSIRIQDIPALVVNAFQTFFTAPSSDYDLIQNTLMRLTYAFLLAVSLAMIGYMLIARVKKISMALFTAFLCLVFPVAVNLIAVMCPDSYIYTLMVYSFVLVLILPFVVFDVLESGDKERNIFVRLSRKAIVLALAVLIFCNTYFTNLNYQIQHYTTQQTANYISSLITQVRMTEGFDTEKSWAFLGKIRDPLIDNNWTELNRHFGYGGNTPTGTLLRNYSWECWIGSYYGYSVPLADDERIEQLRKTDEVKSMPCWPDEGSIKVIDDVVVIKFEEQ